MCLILCCLFLEKCLYSPLMLNDPHVLTIRDEDENISFSDDETVDCRHWDGGEVTNYAD